MPVETQGFNELIGDIRQMAERIDASGDGAHATRKILESAAVPIEEQMKANASSDPQILTGKLHGAISTGNVKKRARSGLTITIGVHRKDWDDGDYYPAFVEFGHGGPRPAPPHPYVRPAFDARQDEAFGIIRDGLLEELKRI